VTLPAESHIAAAIRRLRHLIADALAGGPDPSALAETPEHVALLRRILDDVDDPKALAAALDALCDPTRFAALSRRVVLARAQRFLLALAIARETKRPSQGKSAAPPPANTAAPPLERASDTAGLEDLMTLKGVGPKTAARLAARGIETPKDLLYFLPRRYEDRRHITPMSALRPGMRVVTSGTVQKARYFGPPWKRMLEVALVDDEHTLYAMWFTRHHPPLERFEVGAPLRLAGLVGTYRDKPQMAHPVLLPPEDDPAAQRIVPVYPEVPGVPGRTIEKAVTSALDRIAEFAADPLPEALRQRRALPPLVQALQQLHSPPRDMDDDALDAWMSGTSPAHQRLAYDEFLFIQLALLGRRQQDRAHDAPPLSRDNAQLSALYAQFGFAPTAAQARVIGEISAELAQPQPMRRLLLGDVGSGKTLVAACALVQAAQAGFQAAFMAPTELLAEQHMETLYPILSQMGIRCALYIGNARAAHKKKTLSEMALGQAQVLIGTHALIQEGVQFHNLGLAIVDEQHRFGVAQRLGLVGKGQAGKTPHLLVMTATPIPRTLALTLHGDLDLSVLDGLPPGRQPVATHALSETEREQAFAAVDRAVAAGEQAYIVSPIIEDSEKLDVTAATALFAEVSTRYPEGRAALLHGRIPATERAQIMTAFQRGEVAVLVATTVIEVGINVPKATVMVVQDAQRFGLAQLHQLRGRVGRSHRPSSCYLIANSSHEDAWERMNTLVASGDGFHIAEADLQQRGPGEIYGFKQAGLPGFRFGHILRDAALLEWACEDARQIYDALGTSDAPAMRELREELMRRLRAGDAPVAEEAG
jgi:ATP-dependent DNA helicase RecG